VIVPARGLVDTFWSVLRVFLFAGRRQRVDKQEDDARRSGAEDVAPTSAPNPAVEVVTLAELHDRGLLSDEEYVRRRTQALTT
jgi:Short C-terminal domain